MKLSTKSRYAVQAMVDLAKNSSDKPCNLNEISIRQNISLSYLEQIFNKLKKSNLVFLLWGAYANKKSELIDTKKHLILSAAHPSPFSAHKGFLGCKHFSKTNNHLKSSNQELIDWSLPL